MEENLSYDAHRRRRGPSGRGDRGEDLALGALRPVGQLLSVQPGRVPGDRRRQWLRGFGVDDAAIAAARQEALVWALERGSRSGRVAFQFAQGLRRKARRRERRAAERDERATSGRRRGRRADRRARAASCSPRGPRQGLRRLLGIPGRQARAPASRSKRRCARELHEELGISIGAVRALERDADGLRRMRACACTSARCSTGRASSRCARARRWPGRRCR